jgi:alkanesulfonate monooxygenase SsuD/methylene tetrahydromethanopterin reductase-like flavin-dependent oxidoreductase (luciferase family)
MKVGVILPLGGSGEDGRVAPYREIKELALTVEGSALDSVWVYDHLIYRFPEKPTTGIQEAWTTLTGLAEATNRVQLGCLVFCVPFRNPALLAKMAVALDDVADGRLILGLGAGWHKPEFDAFGYPFDHLVDRFEEALQIIVPLVKTGEVDFTGEYYSAPNCALLPAPKEGGIPVLIASFKPRMLKLTAKYADQWNTAWLGSVDGLAERRASLDAALREAGRDPSTLEVTVGVNVRFPELVGDDDEAPDAGKVISGTVEEVAAGLRGYSEAGAGHLIVVLDPLTKESIELLSKAWELAKA